MRVSKAKEEWTQFDLWEQNGKFLMQPFAHFI